MNASSTTNAETRPTVFISHSLRTEPLAADLALYLQDHGLRSWRAREQLLPGQAWESAVSDALNKASGFVLIVEPETPSSAMRHEWSLALESWWAEEDRKLLVPLFVGDAEVPPFLKGVEGIRIPHPTENTTETFSELVERFSQPHRSEAEPPVSSDSPELELLFSRLEGAIDALSRDETDEDLLRSNREALQAEIDLHASRPESDLGSVVDGHRALSLLNWRLGDYELAKRNLLDAIRGQEELDPSDPVLPVMFTSLGALLVSLGDSEGAVSAYRSALARHDESSAPDPTARALTQRNLGVELHRSGNYPEAKVMLEEALEISEREFGTTHPKVASVALSLGNVLQATKDFDAAKELFERFLASQVDEGDPAAIGQLSFGLGRALRELGDPERAREFLEEALKSNRKQHGETHPSVAATALQLGKTHEDLSELDTAQQAYAQALTVQRSLGNRNAVATALTALGNLARKTGELDAAITYLRDALAESIEARGENDPRNAEILYGLGLTYREMGESNYSAECLDKAVDIGVSSYGENHPRVRRYRRALDHLTSPEPGS